MKKMLVLVAVLVSMVCSGVVSAAEGDSWDYAAQWDAGVPGNPFSTGPWDVGYYYQDAYHLMNAASNVGVDIKFDGERGTDYFGNHTKNNSGATFEVSTWGGHWEGMSWRIDQACLMTAENLDATTTVRFVAPEDGWYSYDVEFESRVMGVYAATPEITDVHVAAAGVNKANGTVTGFAGFEAPAPENIYTKSGTVYLLEDQTIEFSVNDTDGWNQIGLDAVITQVPEPITITLMGLGGLALLRRRR